MDWLLATLNPPMTPLFWTYVRTPEDKRDHATAARARDEASGPTKQLYESLGDFGALPDHQRFDAASKAAQVSVSPPTCSSRAAPRRAPTSPS